jgi:hypothetical protein
VGCSVRCGVVLSVVSISLLSDHGYEMVGEEVYHFKHH